MSKKIGLVTTKEGVVSGVTIVMEQIANGLRERGFDIELIRPVPTMFNDIRVIGYTVQYVMLRETFRNYDIVMGNGVGLIGAADLSTILVDTIHSTSSGANEALQKAYDNLSEQDRGPLEHVLQVICQSTIADLPESFSTKEAAFEIDKRVAARANKVVTISQQITEEVQKHFQVPEEKIVAIPNAVASFWFEKSGDPLPQPRIVYSGRAGNTPINIFLKGFDRVSSVFHSFPDAQKLCILHVGTKTEFGDISHHVIDSPNLSFYTNCTQEEIASHYAKGDIFINTSRYESFGLSLIESMAAGLVPVTFSTGIVPELIEDGVNGFIVHTLAEMHERVAMLLADPAKAQVMGQEAQQAVREKFNMDTMLDGYEALIKELGE